MSKKRKSDKVPLFDVQIIEPASNPMFEEWQHAITKFLIYTKPVACAHCGKKRKRHWTQLRFFSATDMEPGKFKLEPGETVYPPLTPVCADHLLLPEIPDGA